MGVMEILWSFRLALEGKTGKEIPESSRLEFLEKFLGNIFALSDAEDNNSGPLNRGDIADLPLLRTVLAICQNSWELHFWEVMDSFVLVAYASLAALRTLLQQLLSELYFGFRRFILLVPKKKKKDFYEIWQQHDLLKTMERMRFDLILVIRDKYINFDLNPLTKFTSSNKSTEFQIPSHGASLKWSWRPSQSAQGLSYAIKWGILFWVYWKINGDWNNNMIRISQWRESRCRTNTCIKRKKEVQNNRTVRVTVQDPSRNVHLSKIIWDIKIITKFTRTG